jgi:hypothetical protein
VIIKVPFTQRQSLECTPKIGHLKYPFSKDLYMQQEVLFLMKNWKKTTILILVIVIIITLLSELILGFTIGYGTSIRGKFKDGLYIQGEIEYNIDNLNIAGERWEANFYNLSNVYIRFSNVTDELYERTIYTSNLTIIPLMSGDYLPGITLKRITNISKFNAVTFTKGNIDIQLDCSHNHVTGVMEDTTDSDKLGFSDAIIITDDETINASLGRVRFYLSGSDSNIPFNISLGTNYLIYTYTEKGDNIYLKGELWAYDFEGRIWSNGKVYFNNNPQLYGDMNLKITQNPEAYYNHDRHEYDWELEVEGEDITIEGNGFPFWSLGLLISIIPSIIILFYQINKKILKEKKKLSK